MKISKEVEVEIEVEADDIECVCSVCGKALSVSEFHGRFDIDPCPSCMSEKYDEGYEEGQDNV